MLCNKSRTCLVRAYNRGRTECLNSLQLLHETVFRCHASRRQREADGDCGEETLWHIGDNDAYEEYYCVQSAVAKNEGDDEECSACLC